jgi:hypothetical protein
MFSESCKGASFRCSCGVSDGTGVDEDKIQAIYFCRRRMPVEVHLTLNERNIPFLSHVKYLGVIFDRKIIIRRMHIKMMEAKAFRIFIVFTSYINKQLSVNIILTLHKAIVSSIKAYARPA